MSRISRRLGAEFDLVEGEGQVDNDPADDDEMSGFVMANSTNDITSGQTNTHSASDSTNNTPIISKQRRTDVNSHSSHESLISADIPRDSSYNTHHAGNSNDTLVPPSDHTEDQSVGLATDTPSSESQTSHMQKSASAALLMSPSSGKLAADQLNADMTNGHRRSSSRSSDPGVQALSPRQANGAAGLSMDFGQMKVSLIMNDDEDDDYELDDLSISRNPTSEIPNYTECGNAPTALQNITEVGSDTFDWSQTGDVTAGIGYPGVAIREGRRTPTNGQLSDSSGRQSFESASPPGMTRVSSGSKLSSDKKKKPYWYNASLVLSPTYKSRSEDFKRLFKDIPGDERLIVDYSCALQKDILVHGRLYITQSYICFYANIFRWETVLMMRCKDITSMTKEKTARVIPNAIQICTKDDKYFFTSFGTRDKTYLMLFRVWQNALAEHPMTAQELWQWVHYSYGEELGLNSSDDDYVQPSTEDEHVFQSRVQQEENMVAAMEGVGVPDKDETEGSAVPLTNGDASESVLSPGIAAAGITKLDDQTDSVLLRAPPINVLNVDNPNLEEPTDLGDTTEDDEEEVLCTGHEHMDIDVVEGTYNFSVDKLFEMMFTDSQVYRQFTEVKKTTELVQSQWSEDVDSEGDRHRVISYTLSLNYSIGPKTSPATEKQILRSDTKPGAFYLVDTECINGSIPYGDNFYVVNRYCLNRVSQNRCRLKITSAIRYRKSVWGLVKNFIEKNVTNGIIDSFTCMADLLQQESARLGQQANIAPPAGKKKVLRRRRNVSDRTQSIKRIGEPPITQRQSTPVKTHQHKAQGIHSKTGEEWKPTITADVLVKVICAVLVILAVFNGLLYYKLWSLEQKATILSHRPDLWKDIHKQPQTQEEWLQLIEQQQSLHDTEIERWKDVLSTSVVLMQNMQQTLQALEQGINAKYPSSHDPHQDKNHVHDEQ